ncbi:MAG TPA: N-acetylglucosamine-6-phosphate deacetylase [Vicinamibacterales bacterium]|nr:N-acetylglucosamine-6-phosphate deacetylase [Vicinamibacterales bacterium]
MIALAGGDLVLPDGVLRGGTLVIDGDRVVSVEPRAVDRAAGIDVRSAAGLTIVPGFIDVHVHGVAGTDVLDGAHAVAAVAARLPRYGVTAFCPTAVACTPDALETFLDAVERAHLSPAWGSARVLPAHLESNFINPAWKGAQPGECLRVFRAPADEDRGTFSGDDILRVLHARRDGVGIVTLAPELPGGLDLVRLLRDRGHVVSLGHSGATYEQTRAAIAAGVSHATHLFNRMTPLTHREPGAVGAVLESAAVAAEVICDGFHVHPTIVRLAVDLKGPARMMAITDGTAASGLSPGSRAMLGGRPIVVAPQSAQLEDGTLAGSITTMDRVFRMLVREVGLPLPVAARLCATTPADRLHRRRLGRLAVDAAADLAVLDGALNVVQTWIAGRRVGEH